jgi:hypothetical protein
MTKFDLNSLMIWRCQVDLSTPPTADHALFADTSRASCRYRLNGIFPSHDQP